MGYALAYEQTLVTESCGGCGIEFALPASLAKRFQTEGASIRCPNPNCPWPSMSIKETEAARLKKELEAERKRLEFARNAERVQREEAERLGHQLIAARGQMTKLRNRVGKGVCPCCNRSFENLKRHMVSKHPDYAAGELPAEG